MQCKIFRRLDYTPLQLHQTFIILAVLFTVHFYHFLFSKYLHLTERHFWSYILIPFPDSSNLYGHAGTPNKESFDIENFLAVEHFPQKKLQIVQLYLIMLISLQSFCSRLRLMLMMVVEGWAWEVHKSQFQSKTPNNYNSFDKNLHFLGFLTFD